MSTDLKIGMRQEEVCRQRRGHPPALSLPQKTAEPLGMVRKQAFHSRPVSTVILTKVSGIMSLLRFTLWNVFIAQ